MPDPDRDLIVFFCIGYRGSEAAGRLARCKFILRVQASSSGNLDHPAEDAHEIAAPDFLDLFFRISAPEELFCDPDHTAHIITAKDSAAAVEVCPDANIIDSGHADDVVDMIHQLLDCRPVLGKLAFQVLPYLTVSSWRALSLSGFGLGFLI
jgi:hypothetical protein